MERPDTGSALLYSVGVHSVGRVGEVLITIDGTKGHLPLLLRSEDPVAPGYVCSVVKDTLLRFDI